MITPEKAIEAITRQIEGLAHVRNHTDFHDWQKAATSTLTNIYPNREDVLFVSKITAFIWGNHGTIDKSAEAKQTAKGYLESLILDIESFGLPHFTKTETTNEAIHVNVNQHNQQTQTTTVSINLKFILEILKGELRTSEIEALKEILDAEEEPKVKKNRFIDKIKSFGSDVASNILANLLTNPQVYEQLGGML